MPGSNVRPTEVRTRAHKRIRLESNHARRDSALNIQDLPVEIILIILTLVPVCDVILLRQVSRLFRRLLEDEPFWKSLYRNTRIVRPPGPLPRQSTVFLRNSLVASAKVEQSWPPAHSTPIPRYYGPCIPTPYNIRFSSMLGGRWLIAGSNEVIWCYDLRELNPTPRLFYQPHLRANYFRCVSTTNEKGEPLAFAVSETQVGGRMRKLNIYQVHVSPENTEPFICKRLLQFDVSRDGPPAYIATIGPRLLIVSKPHEAIPQNLRVVMDINTLQCYHITTPDTFPPPLPTADFTPFTFCVSTKAYLLLFHIFQTITADVDTVIVAYPISTSSTGPTHPGGTLPLRASHITRIPKTQFVWPALLLEAPSSCGMTRIVLTGKIYSFPCGERHSLAFLDLTLDGTGSMTHTCKPASSVLARNPMWLETGPDGCARGIVCNGHSLELYSFLVDEDGEVSWHFGRTPEGLTDPSTNVSMIAFDGFSGVICVRVQTYYKSYIDVWKFG
ncbi:hypothetical protein F5I97DRAFT_1832479 [Phlebopus sp. FC_14]|nr:hypothetical protein F5I97DRAFT_1832479 [Phlebopus sp. FC_14]